MTSSKKNMFLQLPEPLTDDEVYNYYAAKLLLHKIEFQKMRDKYRQERRALEGFRCLFKQFESPDVPPVDPSL